MGKKHPPSMASTKAMIACRFPACSGVRARAATTNMTPMAAITPASTRMATPSELPHSAPSSRVEPTTSTAMLTTPRMKEVSALPATMERREMGAARRRPMVPFCRSSSRPSTPNWTVRKMKRIAMPAA